MLFDSTSFLFSHALAPKDPRSSRALPVRDRRGEGETKDLYTSHFATFQRFLKSIPALKYASSLTLSLKYVDCPAKPLSPWLSRSTKSQREFVASFLRLKKLSFTHAFLGFDFTVLTDELLLRIPHLSITAVATPRLFKMPLLYKDREAEVIRYCLDFSHLQTGEPKRVRVDGWQFSDVSAKDLIEVGEVENSSGRSIFLSTFSRIRSYREKDREDRHLASSLRGKGLFL